MGAQSRISGRVVSDEGQPRNRVSIMLYDSLQNVKAYAFSQEDGRFALSTKATGSLQLTFRYPNAYPTEVPLTIKNTHQTIDLGRVVVSAIPKNKIKEVVITRKRPIRIKEDTIEYNAQRFATGREMNVEDLLKNLPGISIDSKGKIKFGKTEVSKVLIEGDDLFERGYQTLTQNMPSDPIKTVQVLKNYSENKLLKDLRKTGEIALNLTLKEKAKSRWFGNVVLASTSYIEKMYQLKFNLMNFSKRRKFYFLINANNLGLNEMNGVKYLIRPNISTQAENIGSELRSLSIINIHRRNGNFDEERTNFNKDKLVSLNYIYNFRKEWKLKFVTIFNPIENRNYVNSLYKFHHDGLEFTNKTNKTWKQNIQNIVGKLEIQKEFQNQANFKFYNKISSVKEDNENTILFNDTPNNQTGTNRLLAAEHLFTYTKKLDSSRAWVGVAKFVFQERPYQFTEHSDVFQHLLNLPQAEFIEQSVTSRLQFYGAKATYLQKLGKDHNLELQAGYQHRSDFLGSEISLFDKEEQAVAFDKTEFANDTDLRQNTVFLKAKYHLKTKKWNFNISLNNFWLKSELNNVQQSAFYLAPSLNVSYELARKQSLRLGFNRSFSTTSIDNLYTHFIYEGNRSFSRNDVGYRRLPRFGVSLGYQVGRELDQALNISVNYMQNEDYLSNNMMVNPNYTMNQRIVVEDQNVFSTQVKWGQYLQFASSRLTITGNYMSSNYKSKVNNSRWSETFTHHYKIGAALKSGWLKGMNYELGYFWKFNHLKNSFSKRKYLDQNAYVNVYYNFNPNLVAQTKLEYYHFGGADQKSTQFWDVILNYKLKKHKIKLFLKAKNLLNSDEITNYSIDNVSESLYTQRLLPRHVVLGIVFNF